MKKKTLFILGAGLEQTIAIRQAKQMGLKVIAADNNPNAVGLRLADIGIQADLHNIPRLIAIAKKHHVDGVMTHAVEIPFIVASVAKALGLPHLHPSVAQRATDKFKRITHLKNAGLPTPKFAAVTSLEGAKKIIQKIGFPAIIKPTDNAGARGVKRVNALSELADAFQEAYAFSKSKEILLEEMLTGLEISTEHFVHTGSLWTTGFADRNYSRVPEFFPYFVEDGHSVPSTLPLKMQKRVIDTCERAIRALGIDWGVAKGDILIKGNTVYVLEMAARTSGGWFAAGTVPIATGVHLLKSLIRISIGQEPREKELLPSKHAAACQRYIIPNKDGIFQKYEGIVRARTMLGVKVLQMFKKPKKGEIIHKARNNGERFGHVIAEGNTVEEATERCENAVKKIHVVLKPLSTNTLAQ